MSIGAAPFDDQFLCHFSKTVQPLLDLHYSGVWPRSSHQWALVTIFEPEADSSTAALITKRHSPMRVHRISRGRRSKHDLLAVIGHLRRISLGCNAQNLCGQAADGRCVKDVAQGQLDMQRVADARQHSRGQQGVATEFEKVVVYPNPIDA